MRFFGILAVAFACLVLAVVTGGPSPMSNDAKVEAAGRSDVYDERADARKEIATALEHAKKDGKRVLITWGANRCGWCHHLKEQKTSDPTIQELMKEFYLSINVDLGQRNKHMDLAREYGVDFDNNYIPHMTILQENGGVAGHQKPGDLSVDGDNGRRVYSKERIAAFLSKHKPARVK